MENIHPKRILHVPTLFAPYHPIMILSIRTLKKRSSCLNYLIVEVLDAASPEILSSPDGK